MEEELGLLVDYNASEGDGGQDGFRIFGSFKGSYLEVHG